MLTGVARVALRHFGFSLALTTTTITDGRGGLNLGSDG